jgi:hypothetical protein
MGIMAVRFSALVLAVYSEPLAHISFPANSSISVDGAGSRMNISVGGRPSLHLTANGGTGVGTVTPLDTLHVVESDAGQQVATFESTRSGDTDGTYIKLKAHSGAVERDGVHLANVADEMHLWSGGAKRMVLDANGAMALGDSSGATLEMGTMTTATRRAVIAGGGDSIGRLISFEGLGGYGQWFSGTLHVTYSDGTYPHFVNTCTMFVSAYMAGGNVHGPQVRCDVTHSQRVGVVSDGM